MRGDQYPSKWKACLGASQNVPRQPMRYHGFHRGDGMAPAHNSLILFEKIRHHGGAEGNRTPDLLIANEALSHLSYSPTVR